MTNTARIFAAGLMLGAILMDLINVHLYRLGTLIHWIDILALCLWPLLIWTLYPLIEERKPAWSASQSTSSSRYLSPDSSLAR